MPFNSSIYTDLELPSLNQDNSTYGTIINTYFQALETKLKNLSDRINAAGVGDSSTLAQINSDIDGILPDPYAGDYSTVSTWPSYNTELTALGLSPPETASEINTFFDGGDFATFANFLNGKLDSIDAILTTAESDIDDAETDICKANLYSEKINDVDIEWELQSTDAVDFRIANSAGSPNLYSSFGNGSVASGTPPPSGTYTASNDVPSITGYALSDLGTILYRVNLGLGASGSLTADSSVEWTYSDGLVSGSFSLSSSSWVGGQPGLLSGGYVYSYIITFKKYKLIIATPDTSGC